MVEQQREQIAALLEQVHDLEALLAKDSHNSSKPPSSDGLARRMQNKELMAQEWQEAGRELGHCGETLRLVTTPDMVVEQWPAVCAGCQVPLAADAPVVLRERRQV
ncbi:MAG TPA: DUF6444 domain-containing protein [Ktedonobacterales bacterium]